MAAIDYASFRSVSYPFMLAGYGIMMRGRHGIGKSGLVYQVAPELPKLFEISAEDLRNAPKDVQAQFRATGKYEYPIVERRASQMPDAGDIMGLPFLDGDVTKFRSMEWFHIACVQPVVLFFDELDRAPMDVRQALFELGDSRKIAGRYLHPKTVMICACNSGPHDNNTYQVGEFDVAELDRWMVFDVDPSEEDFFLFARTKLTKSGSPLDPVIYDFLKQNTAHLEHKGEFETNKVYPSRRSWDRLDHVFKKTEWLKDPTVKGKNGQMIPRPEITYAAQAAVGEEAAIAFAGFVKSYRKQITLEDIIVHGKLERAQDLDEAQYMALIEKFEQSKYAKNELKGDQLINVCRFLYTVPDEMAMKVWEVATREFPMNGVHIHGVELRKKDYPELDEDVAVSDYMAYLNGAGRETAV